MKADLTRRSYDAAKTFSRVVMQQGRVQLDADWNEQAAITLHAMRRLARDIGGQAWTSDSGFLPLDMPIGPVTDDVAFTPGTFYVDGVLCENASTPVALTRDATKPNVLGVAQWTVDDRAFAVGQFLQLSDGPATATSPICKITVVDYANSKVTVNDASGLPNNAANPQATRLVTYATQPFLPSPPGLFAAKGSVELYLDVWERLITSLEDDSIREVALNGPDTAARTRVIWQVKTTPGPALRGRANPVNSARTAASIAQQQQPLNRGLLRARVQPSAPSTDPCAISPTSHYRGPENQLYRVEIHDGGPLAAGPTFKWSRENGAVVFGVLGPVATGNGSVTVTLASLGRDERFCLAQGDWVELQDDALVLGAAGAMTSVGPLLQVQSINKGARQVTLTGAAPAGFGGDPSLRPLLRRWDQKAGDPSAGGVDLTAGGVIAVPGQAGRWIDLEDGVQVRFEATATATYRCGDYWLIPARVATGDVIWPTELDSDGEPQPVARAPDGVDHHYAPLAIVAPANNAVPTINPLVTTKQV
jgi:hypothetical protein